MPSIPSWPGRLVSPGEKAGPTHARDPLPRGPVSQLPPAKGRPLSQASNGRHTQATFTGHFSEKLPPWPVMVVHGPPIRLAAAQAAIQWTGGNLPPTTRSSTCGPTSKGVGFSQQTTTTIPGSKVSPDGRTCQAGSAAFERTQNIGDVCSPVLQLDDRIVLRHGFARLARKAPSKRPPTNPATPPINALISAARRSVLKPLRTT